MVELRFYTWGCGFGGQNETHEYFMDENNNLIYFLNIFYISLFKSFLCIVGLNLKPRL